MLSADQTGSPSGVVNFRSGETDLGSALLDSEGNASLQTDILPAGTHQVVAIYQGKSAYQSSTSRIEPLHANVSTVAGFTVAATPTSLSTPVGGFVSSVVTVTPVNGFNAYVSLSCTGLPINATCTFTPVNVPAACTTSASGAETCTPGTSVMQIQTQTPSPLVAARTGDSGIRRYAFVFPAVFGLAGLGLSKRRAWRNLLLAMLVFSGAMGMTACSERYNYLNPRPPREPWNPSRELHHHRPGPVIDRRADDHSANPAANYADPHRGEKLGWATRFCFVSGHDFSRAVTSPE